MFTKTLVLAALGVGFVAAFCPPCQQTSQQEAYQKADIVAHVKVNNVQGGGLSGGGVAGSAAPATGSMRHMRQMNGGAQAGAALPQQEPVTYQVNIVKSFKGGADGQKTTVKSSGDLTCSGIRMLANQEYLIAGKRNGSSIEITKCGGIPLTTPGISNGPILWTVAENNQQFSQGLSNGFKNSGSQQQQGGMMGALPGLQKPNSTPGAAAGVPPTFGGQQSQSSQSTGSQSGSQGQSGMQQGGQSSQGGQSQDSQSFPNAAQSQDQQQGGQDQQFGQQGQQGGQQGSQESQGQQGGQQQGGQDSQSQDSQSQQGSSDQQQQLMNGQQPQTEEEKQLQKQAAKQAEEQAKQAEQQQQQQPSSRGMHSRGMQMRRW